MKSRKYHFNYPRERRGCFIGVGYGTDMVTGKWGERDGSDTASGVRKLYGRTRAGVQGMEFDYPCRISARPCMAILAASMVFWYIMIFFSPLSCWSFALYIYIYRASLGALGGFLVSLFLVLKANSNRSVEKLTSPTFDRHRQRDAVPLTSFSRSCFYSDSTVTILYEVCARLLMRMDEHFGSKYCWYRVAIRWINDEWMKRDGDRMTYRAAAWRDDATAR